MEINLDFIFQEPSSPDKKVKLIIEPLAPLSMVSDIPGAYYKTLEIPDKYKLCGLFENILGWHFDKADRDAIHKKRKGLYEKRNKDKKYISNDSNSGFRPLLFDYFEMGIVLKHGSIQYNDLWKRAFSRLDAYVHANGSPNLNYETLKTKPKNLDNKSVEVFLKANKSKYPMFYTSPTLREFIAYDGTIQIGLIMSERLYTELKQSLETNSTAYLGTSEGWVEINIEEI
ncbi:MAG: type I-PGING CRISPR-associated protein Cas5p [Raineya sp.]|jgi:CRISPR-associated protein Cas5|nr:type I-PGING CRISPR-associated protein Cas5p [Raineya sp.]